MYACMSSHDTGRLPPTPEKRVDHRVERQHRYLIRETMVAFYITTRQMWSPTRDGRQKLCILRSFSSDGPWVINRQGRKLGKGKNDVYLPTKCTWHMTKILDFILYNIVEPQTQGRTSAWYGHLVIVDSFLCPRGKKALTFSPNSTRLISTPVNADNRHLFLAQSTNSHGKPTSLMWSLHYQLCAVIDLSFLKVKNPSVDSMSMFPVLPYTE